MSYQNIEGRIESALKSAVDAAIEASETLTGYGISVRTYWCDDAAGADSFALPLIGIMAEPNVPYGYHGFKRRVPVNIIIATAQPDDRDRAVAKAIYDAVREILDEDTVSHAELAAIAIEIADGGTATADADVNIISLSLNAQIDSTPVTTTTTTTTTT